MKNISIITFVAILSACAGSGGPDERFQEHWSSRYSTVTANAAESNKKVTSMVSEISLCEGNCEEHNIRVIGGPSHNPYRYSSRSIKGGTVTVYNLEDVTFTMAAASAGSGDNAGNKDLLKFHLDKNGRIDAVEHSAMVFDGEKYVKDESASATISRNTEENITWDVDQVNGEGKHYTGSGTFKTYGDTLELSYSDFGQMDYDLHYTKGTESGDEKSYEPFAGGYDNLKHDKPVSSMNFSGKAVGSVSNGDYNQAINGNATLSFDGTQEELDMKFSGGTNPWYDVKITKSDSTNSITFMTKDGLTVDDHVKFNDFVGNEREKTDYLVDGYNGATYDTSKKQYGKIDIGYYGIGNNVVEATGVTQYVENNITGTPGEIRMNVGFGMTKDNNN